MPIPFRVRGLINKLVTLLLVLAACGGERSRDPSVDSNTNWLQACAHDGDCAKSLACICGLCTRGCADDLACSSAGLACWSPATWTASERCGAPHVAPALSYCGAACTPGLACAVEATARAAEDADAATTEPPVDEIPGGELSVADLPMQDVPGQEAPLAPPAESAERDVSVTSSRSEVAPVEDASASNAAPWEVDLSICNGSVSIERCPLSRVSDGGSPVSRLRVYALSLYTDGHVEFLPDLLADAAVRALDLDGGALPTTVGTFRQKDDTSLDLTLEAPAGLEGLAAGLYAGTRDGTGCYSGSAPSDTPPASFRLCSRQ